MAINTVDHIDLKDAADLIALALEVDKPGDLTPAVLEYLGFRSMADISARERKLLAFTLVSAGMLHDLGQEQPERFAKVLAILRDASVRLGPEKPDGDSRIAASRNV